MAFAVDGRHVVVAGGARSGRAAAALLVRRGARVTVTDRKPEIETAGALAALGVRLELGGHRPETFASADLVVVSPGVPLHQPAIDAARQAGVHVIGELELASRWLRGRIVAITGTKGKSTTTTLTGRMLEAAGLTVRVGGNIGVPLADQVDDSTPDTIHVIEASSFQLEATDTFHPWIAALLNFSPDHLDQHASVDEYAAAKARIFANQTAGDWAVVNADDAPATALAGGTRAARIDYGLTLGGDGFTIEDGSIVQRRGASSEPLVPVSAVQVPGRHILSDVIAAAAISRTAGAGAAAMTAATRAFRGLEHAMELAGEVERVHFVNDSKATNVESARRSIESLPRGVVAIVGGRYKGGDFGELREPLRLRGRAVVAIGEAASRVREALGATLPVIDAASMADAVARGFEAAKPDGVVVLAPACSSFDWFEDYAARGEAFKAAVKELTARV